MIKLLAILLTLVATFITASAAGDRGGTLIDKSLLVAMWVALVLAVHLLPANIHLLPPIVRRWMAWPLWFGCLLATIYGQYTFVTHSNLRANEARAQQSALTVGTEKQVVTVRESLKQITARPISIVSAELAKERDKRVMAALKVEIKQGQKAELLRDELVRLSQVSTLAQVSGANDPDVAKLSRVSGLSEELISFSIEMFVALLFELFGATLWLIALRPSKAVSVKVEEVAEAVTRVEIKSETISVIPIIQAVTPVTLEPESRVTDSVTPVSSHVTAPVTQPLVIDGSHDVIVALKEAIDKGKCKPTVTSIQEFLSIARAKAAELRRMLKVQFSI